MNWYFKVLRKYAVFSGRARRKEFWSFTLIQALVLLLLIVIDIATGTYQPDARLGLLSGLYLLAMLVPSLAVSARRLHDANLRGWWQLLVLTGLGSFVLLYLYLLPGQPSENRFGPDPKIPDGSRTIPGPIRGPVPPPATAGAFAGARRPPPPPPPVVLAPAHPQGHVPVASPYATLPLSSLDSPSCPSCGAPVKGLKFCRQCGTSLQPKSTCSSCGTRITPGAQFCEECGTQVT
jgi:uncharacterized membrane protein YhaH (DUF805 family)